MTTGAFSIAAALAVAAIAPMAAQQTAPPPPVFRSASELVEVDVVVHDKDGRFVSDLAPGDFEIREQGEPQPIQQFYLHITSSGGAAGAVPGIASNASVASGSARRTFVVVFDDAHMTPGGFKRTQAAAVSLFSQHFRSGDVGGVMIG